MILVHNKEYTVNGAVRSLFGRHYNLYVVSNVAIYEMLTNDEQWKAIGRRVVRFGQSVSLPITSSAFRALGAG